VSERHQRPRAHHVEFRGVSGHRLAASRYAPEGARKGVAMLLHGGGQTRHAWDATAARLADQGFVALSVDQRGHGDSAWVRDHAYTFLDFADDARAVAAQIEADERVAPAAIGASLGGIASMLALGRSPRCFSALVLVDVTPRLQSSGVASVTGFMREHVREGFASIEEAAEAVARYLPHRPRPSSSDGLRKNLRQREDGRFYWHWDPAFLDGPRPVVSRADEARAALERAAPTFAVPTLLARGQSSELVGEAEAKHFLDLCPQAEQIDVAGARHMVAGDRNDVFASVVLEFLTRAR
jgi:pimeloyl-ACP methyl ester carboxylesterase